MQDPVRELPHVIRLLTESKTLHAQRLAVEKYFTSDAEFEHPLCAVTAQRSLGVTNLVGINSSRDLILGVYQWYKVLFTDSKLNIKSITYNREEERIYTEMDQTVTYKYLPIPGRTLTASLVSVITLRKGYEPQYEDDEGHGGSDTETTRELWYIAKQEDLYQTDEWVHYLPVPGGKILIHLCKLTVGYLCSVGAFAGKSFKLC